MNRIAIVASALSCLLLAACGSTKPADLAGPEGNRDGQTLAAKPGLGRLYLIQGFLTDGPVPVEAMTDGTPDFYVYSKTPQTGTYVPPAGSPQAVGALAANVALAIIGAAKDKPETFVHLKPLTPRSFFYIGKNKLADIGEGDYLALDLPPGSYDLKLCLGLRDCPVVPLSIEADKVIYLLSDADTPYGPFFEVCRKDCGKFIQNGRRVIAWDPITKRMQPK